MSGKGDRAKLLALCYHSIWEVQLSQEIDRQEMAIRYLLGTLSEEEKTRLEEEYFLDDEEFEQLEIAEDELIDRYVRTELSTEDTHRFEKLLISPRLSERVEVARILVQRTASHPQKQEVKPTPEVLTPRVEPRRASWWENLFGPAAAVPAFRPAMAFALTLMLLTSVALIFVWTKLRNESQRLAQEQQQRGLLQKQIEEEKARSAQLDEQLKQTRQEQEEQQRQFAEKYEQLAKQQQPAQALVFPFFLSPSGGTRSGGGSTPTMTIPGGVRSVDINVNVTHGDYPSYNAFLRNVDSGNEIDRRTNVKPVSRQGRKIITLNVEAKRLIPGSYTVHLDGVTPSGVENFEDYEFRVRSVSR